MPPQFQYLIPSAHPGITTTAFNRSQTRRRSRRPSAAQSGRSRRRQAPPHPAQLVQAPAPTPDQLARLPSERTGLSPDKQAVIEHTHHQAAEAPSKHVCYRFIVIPSVLHRDCLDPATAACFSELLPPMEPYPIQLEISGPTAMWTRPDTGSSPAPYVAPTFSAVKRSFAYSP